MRIWLALATASFIVQAAPALAERDKWSGAPVKPNTREIPSPITDRFYVRGIFYAPAVSTDLRIDAANGTRGTLLSGEKDLGLASRLTQGRMELMFRLRERNRLRVDYFHTGRYAQKTLDRTINFGDQTFALNDLVASSLDVRIFGLTYTYSLFRRERFEIGTGLGIYLLQGEARGEVPARQQRQDVSGVGAFPTPALDAAWRISSHFAATARAQYLRASVNDVTGSLGDYHADVQYRWTPHFTLGAGYTILRLRLDVVNHGSFPGLVALNVRGPEVFFRISF